MKKSVQTVFRFARSFVFFVVGRSPCGEMAFLISSA